MINSIMGKKIKVCFKRSTLGNALNLNFCNKTQIKITNGIRAYPTM